MEAAVKLNQRNYDHFYVNGKWVEPSGTGTIDVINSTTEDVMGRVPEGTPKDINAAVTAAQSRVSRLGGNARCRARATSSESLPKSFKPDRLKLQK